MEEVATIPAKDVLPKGISGKKIESVPKPNVDEFKARQQVVDAKISELNSAIGKINECITEKSRGREELEQRKSEIRKRLDEIQAQIEPLEAQKNEIFEKMGKQNEQTRVKRSQALQMKKDMQFSTLEEIDEKIDQLEQSLISQTFTLKQEKNIVQQLQNLQRMKPTLKDYTLLEKDAKDSETSQIAPLATQLENIKLQLQKLHEKRKKESEHNRNVFEQREKQMGPVKEFFNKRWELQSELSEARQQLMAIRDEHRQAEIKYKAFLDQLRSAKQDQMQEDRRNMELRRKKEELMEKIENLECNVADVPGLQLLQQTAAYVKKLADDAKGQTEETNLSPSSSNTAPAQMDEDFREEIVPKKQRDNEFYQGKKKSGRKGGRKLGTQKKSGLISHDFQVFADFQQLDVDPPLNYSDAAICLEKLNIKIRSLELGQKDREDDKKERIKHLQDQLEALEANLHSAVGSRVTSDVKGSA